MTIDQQTAAKQTFGLLDEPAQNPMIRPIKLFDAMLRLVVFVVVGGVGTIWGVIAGTVVLSLATELLRGLHAYEALAYGIIIVAVMLFLPDGIGGLARRLWEAR